jgi:superfamily I DNA/RNA helicase
VRIDPLLGRIPFWSAVAFPYIEFDTASDEWHSWQVIEMRRFRRHPIATLVREILRNARSHLTSRSTSCWFHETEQLPDLQQSAAIARILRPSFEFVEKAPDRRARQRADILRYTEEQFAALDAMAENDRVLFLGPAGTGKTVLAIEAARRAVEAGNDVLFLCYNKLLGLWLSQQSALLGNKLTVTTLHQYMLAVASVTPPADAEDVFWRVQLPDNASLRLLDGHSDFGRFDTLIIDELQDLLEPAYLDIFDIAVRGGLNSGHWLMFGDFERQMLYGQDRKVIEELVRARLGTYARCSLRVNCRNTPRIATLSHLLGKLTPNYSRVLRPDDQVEPVITYYATPSQQRKALVTVLERLHNESFNSDDIVVLSPKARPRCISASLTEQPWSERLAPLGETLQGRIPYTTIQSFKGLESPAIVVTDIEHLDGELFSSLFYVATTRPLERIYIIVHETAKPDIINALLDGPKDRI